MTASSYSSAASVAGYLIAMAGIVLAAGGAAGAPESDSGQLLRELNVHLARYSRVEGCVFPGTTEISLSRVRRDERGGSPLSTMERRFMVPARESVDAFEAYEALRQEGFIRDNPDVAGHAQTFSITMKGWKAFPLNRGGQATCIEWSARESAIAIERISDGADGVREIVYRAGAELPEWLPPREKARYVNRQGRALLPASLSARVKYAYSGWFGDLAANDPARVRAQFPSDSSALGLAQKLLDDRIASHNEPCVFVAAGKLQPRDGWRRDAATQPAFYFPAAIHPQHLGLLRALSDAGYLREFPVDPPVDMHGGVAVYGFQLQAPYMALLGKDGRNTCIRYGTAVAREVVKAPDGRPGYIQNFIVRYGIEDLRPWLSIAGVRGNLPENVRLCIEHGSIVEVEATGRGGGMHGCSLPWADI